MRPSWHDRPDRMTKTTPGPNWHPITTAPGPYSTAGRAGVFRLRDQAGTVLHGRRSPTGWIDHQTGRPIEPVAWQAIDASGSKEPS